MRLAHFVIVAFNNLQILDGAVFTAADSCLPASGVAGDFVGGVLVLTDLSASSIVSKIALAVLALEGLTLFFAALSRLVRIRFCNQSGVCTAYCLVSCFRFFFISNLLYQHDSHSSAPDNPERVTLLLICHRYL